MTAWTPIFVGIFLAIVTYVSFGLGNQAAFDEASRLAVAGRNDEIMTDHS